MQQLLQLDLQVLVLCCCQASTLGTCVCSQGWHQHLWQQQQQQQQQHVVEAAWYVEPACMLSQ
jgi:hypothetical protein